MTSKSYDEKKRLGICVTCNSKSTNGVYCLRHATENREKSNKRVQRLKSLGLCLICEDPSSGKAFCKKCSIKDKNRQETLVKRRVVQGLCARCGRRPSRLEFQNCETCYSKQKQKRQSAGFFIRRARSCISSLASKKKLKSSLKPLELALFLKRLWRRQRGLCSLSGRKLNRFNCELDHITPQSKGGLTTEDNLRFLHKDVNQAVSALTDLDFIHLCSDVVSFNQGKP